MSVVFLCLKVIFHVLWSVSGAHIIHTLPCYMNVHTIFLNFNNASYVLQLVTVLLFLVAIFFSFRVVRLTAATHRRAHIYILIALLFALFVAGLSLCGLQSLGNIPAANIGNIFSAIFFVLGFTLYAKLLKKTIKEDNNTRTTSAPAQTITNASGDTIRS